MDVEVRTTEAGDGINKPKSGDTVRLWFRGYICDEQMPEKKGRQFDASENHKQDFETLLGQGKTIRGFEEGIVQMSLGETATLIITSDYAYGERAFPGFLPANTDLVFDVKLNAVGDIKAVK